MACRQASPLQAPILQTASSVGFVQGGPPLRRVATATALLQSNGVGPVEQLVSAGMANTGGRAPPPAGTAAGTASVPARLGNVAAAGALGAGLPMRAVTHAADPLGGSRRSSSMGASQRNLVTSVGYEASGHSEAVRWKTGGGSTSSTSALWHAKVQQSPAGSGTYAIGSCSPQGGSARLAAGFQYASGSSLVLSDGGSHKVPQGTATWTPSHAVTATEVFSGGSTKHRVGGLAQTSGSKASPFVSLSPSASREGSLKIAAAAAEGSLKIAAAGGTNGHATSVLLSASGVPDSTLPPAAASMVVSQASGASCDVAGASGLQRVPPWARTTATAPYVASAAPVPVPFISSVPSSSARSFSALPSRPVPHPSPRGLSQAASTGQLMSGLTQPGLVHSQAGSAGRLPVGPPLQGLSSNSQPGSTGRLPVGPPLQGLSHSQVGSAGRLPVGPPQQGLSRSGTAESLPTGPQQQDGARSQSPRGAGQKSQSPTSSGGGSVEGKGLSANGSSCGGGSTLSAVNRSLAKSWRISSAPPAVTPTQVLPYVPPGAEIREHSPEQVLLYVPPSSEGGSDKLSLTPSPAMQYREVQVSASAPPSITEADMASKLRLLENEVLRLSQLLDEERNLSASLRGALEEGAKAMRHVNAPPAIRPADVHFDSLGHTKADISDDTEAAAAEADAVDDSHESRLEERLSDATLSPAPWSPPRPLGAGPPPQPVMPSSPQDEVGTPENVPRSAYRGLDGFSQNVDDGPSRSESPSEDRVESAAFAAVERLRSMNDHGGAAIAERILASIRTAPGNTRKDVDKDAA